MRQLIVKETLNHFGSEETWKQLKRQLTAWGYEWKEVEA